MTTYTPAISEEAYANQLRQLAADKRLRADNIELPQGATSGLSRGFMFAGAAGLLLTIIGALAVGPKHALAAYHAATMAALAPCLGALLLVMIFHMLNSHWSVTLRRQFEHLMSMAPWIMLLLIPTAVIELVSGGTLFAWISSDDYLAQHKYPFLNEPFWILRGVIYWGIIYYLTKSLSSWSREQDRTGDRWLTAKMRRTSAWGIPVAALTIAFMSFDWLMSIDHHFFSTMWGVYYFAACAFSALAVIAVVSVGLRASGRLTGVVTTEHDHDHGKLLFSFTVFWAYIAYSQYFLIWYSNIPEETAFMNVRKSGGWEFAFYALIFGHFILPFLLLLPRTVKRIPSLLGILALGMIAIHIFDLFWIVRPEVYAHPAWKASLAPGLTPEESALAFDTAMAKGGILTWWVDLVAIIGVMGVFFGMLLKRIGDGPLIPIQDPRLPQALGHKNYV